MMTKPALWTAWCVGTSPAANTTACSPVRAARAFSRGAFGATSTTPAGMDLRQAGSAEREFGSEPT